MIKAEPDPSDSSDSAQSTPSDASITPVKKDDRSLLYIEAVRYLNTLRKNILIYPSGHVQVGNSLKNGIDSLKALFCPEKKQVTIGVLKHEISIDGETLDSLGPVNREFAASLKLHDIAAVIFTPEIEKEELGRFLEIVTRTREIVEEEGGLERVLGEASFRNIQVKRADFSKLVLTRETEISQSPEEDETSAGEFSWKGFIGSILSETAKESSFDERGGVAPDPSALAGLINDNRVDRTMALKHYRELLDSQLKKREGGAGKMSSGEPPVGDSLTHLLNGLNPEMRKQFLSETLMSCSEAGASGADAQPVLGGLGENLVTEMLHLANEKGRGISPSLLAFIGKISKASAGRGADLSGGLTSHVQGSRQEVSLGNVTNLFNREKRENTVSDGYREVLDNLSGRVRLEAPVQSDSFSIEEHLKTLEESSIDFQIARVLLSFMETNVTGGIYSDYSGQLMAGVMKADIMERSRFLFLVEVSGALTHHVKDKPDLVIREAARKALGMFRDEVFIARVVQAYDMKGMEFGQDAFDFMVRLGSRIVPEVLERYAGRGGNAEKRHLLKLLLVYRREALTEAKKHLQDLMPSFLCNIVVFIHDAGEKDDVADLKPLLRHNDLKVKTEALSALLKFNNSWGISSLRKMLLSDSDELQKTAIRLSGKFRVKEVVPDLISMISRIPLFDGAIRKNGEVVKSLGMIADREAIPVFEKLVSCRVPFHTESLSRMKVSVYEALAGFQFSDIRGLVDKGSVSSIYRIKQICHELKNRNRKK